MRARKTFLWLFVLGFFVAQASAAPEPPERTRLYTAPDPASPGGLQGSLIRPEAPLEQILALPTATPESVYQGEISGSRRDHFLFKGLPMGKYDLIAIYDADFYEGLRLEREQSTLTKDDLQKIDAIVQKSEPFFTRKIIHRVEGQTGRGNLARGLCTFFRDTGSNLVLEQFEGKSSRPDFRRTYKLVLLKDVGPGWQVVRARDLYPVWMKPDHALPQHHFSEQLTQIRVADEIKDLGNLDLSR
jgi:hypothetical protein